MFYNPTEVNNINFDYEMETMPSKIDCKKCILRKKAAIYYWL